MRGAIPPLTQHICMVWHLIKHRDTFTPLFLEIYHRLQLLAVLFLYCNTLLIISDFLIVPLHWSRSFSSNPT